jgi:hypothetical protein
MKNVLSAMFVACAVSMSVSLAAQGDPATRGQQPGAQGVPPATQSPQTGTEGQQAPDIQAPAEQRRQPAPASSRAAQDKVTISGCIQNAPAAAAGGAAPASASESKFVLAKGKMANAAGANAGAAIGTTGTTAAGTQYRLEGDEKALSPHLNHQVEITGTVQSSSASATGAANAAPGSAATQTLKVDSVKMVSATCQ